MEKLSLALLNLIRPDLTLRRMKELITLSTSRASFSVSKLAGLRDWVAPLQANRIRPGLIRSAPRLP